MKNKTLPIDETVMEIIVGLHIVFQPDYGKMCAWLKTENLNFGGSAPIDLINSGRAKKVLQFIDSVDAE